MSATTLSIALVTRNRPQSLHRFLESMRAQNVQPTEIVISDDSDLAVAAEVRTLGEAYGCEYVVGPRRGLYANRNNAARACTGTHILTADDDHTHPSGFIETICGLIQSEPDRIWVVSERNPEFPERQHVCPAELRANGQVGRPDDESNCRAIADGSTVYPSDVFARTTGYDENFEFGGLWYLWGVYLYHHGWRMTYSAATFVWHHLDGSVGRAYDREFLRRQLCCNSYVALAHALYLEPSLGSIGRSLYHSGGRFLFSGTIIGYKVKARLNPRDALTIARKVYAARARYLSARGARYRSASTC
jgi:glycosyltransferase involved in cell wall biosynthesis